MTATFDATPGTFPDLEIISELGHGAETVVYRVRRRGTDYSLKLMTTVGDDPRALTALRREAALLGCVDHPLLPRIYEVGQVEAGPYLILQYIDGNSLSELLTTGRLDEARALRLAIDIVGPLAAAHRSGLVHRDVKPDNIIIEPDGTARLIDFGLVFRGGAPHDRVAGTLLYSAPEQTGGMPGRPVDGRSDLYALGVLLFEAVTGQTPYYSLDANDLIRQHALAPVPDPRSIRPELSPMFAAVVGKLMAKDPDDRYQGGESLLADLKYLRDRPGALFQVGWHAGDAGSAGPDVLIGRDQEVVELANRWLKAREGRGGAAIVEGPAGVGKSRLVRELTSAVAHDGDLILYGKCVPDDPVPLAPLRAAVERYLRTVDRLPPADRERTVERLRRAAGRGGPLLRALSPLLANLVQAPDIGERDRHEQFINAVAAFLLGLADEFQGAMLHIDDVQWLDGPTHRVLERVTSRLPGTPLLVIATSRDDSDSAAALERFAADMDATLDTRIYLRPLGRDAVSAVVAYHLGGVRLAGEVIDELASRAGGNPFTVVEYISAVIDAGLITPSWTGWHLDLAGLDRLDLSGDALDLVLQRIDGLGAESRRLLAAAAATGRRFHADLVARVCDVNPQHGRVVLAEAETRRLVAASGGQWYRFRHDQIREALLAGLGPATTRRLHQRIAEVLEATGSDEPRYVYLRARHFALGETDRTPQKVYASGLAAGKLALADHAPAEAREFLRIAAAAGQAAGLPPTPDLHLALGISCTRAGRFGEALAYLEQALRAEPDPLRRADVLVQIAWVHLGAWNPDSAFDAVRRGLAELGRPLPGATLVVRTLTRFLVGLAVGLTKLGFGTARGDGRQRFRLEAILLDAGAYASSMRMRRRMRLVLGLRALYPINRLGPGPEYVRHIAGFGVISDVIGRPRLADKLYDRAGAVAAEVGDPVLMGHVEWKRGAGKHLSAADDGQTWMRALVEHERWLELGDYLTGVSSTCVQLVKRGRTHDALAWYQRGRARLAPGAQAEGAAFGAAAAAIAAQRGRPEEAAAGLDALRRFLTLNPNNRPQIINLFCARIMVLVEMGELGAPFDEVTAEFAMLGMQPTAMVPEQRVYFVYEALGRLTRCHLVPPGSPHLSGYRAAAEHAVELLGKVADTRPLRAFYRVARADLEVLAGHPEKALRNLAHAELALLPLDAPLIAYEMARVRARALRALDEPAQARMQARYALMFAVDQEWHQRIRWIRSEFGISGSTPSQITNASLARTVQVSDGRLSLTSP